MRSINLTPLLVLALACSEQSFDGPEARGADDPNAGGQEQEGSLPPETLAIVGSRAELDSLVADTATAGQRIGGLEVRLVDAPVQADAVWVTFCGVHVQALALDAENPAATMPSGQEPSDAEGQATDAQQPAAEQPPADEQAADAGTVDEAEEDMADRGDGEPGWLTVSEQCSSVDLLTLQNGVFQSMSTAVLPTGRYGQIRLMLTNAWVMVGGERHDLIVPSGEQSGLKINGGFDLVPGEVTTLTVDFDAARSVIQTGNGGYKMTPVIFLARVERSDGNVDVRAEGPDATTSDDEHAVAGENEAEDQGIGAAKKGGSSDADVRGTSNARDGKPEQADNSQARDKQRGKPTA